MKRFGLLSAVAVVIACGVFLLVSHYGWNDVGTREIVRWTARVSVVLFCVAFAFESRPSSLPPWAGRSTLLRSLALSHTVHAAAVLALATFIDNQNLEERSSFIDVAGGGLAYVFIYWAALKPDSRVASIGLFWVWIVFMSSYGGRALERPLPFAFPVALLLLAIAFRVLKVQRVQRVQ